MTSDISHYFCMQGAKRNQTCPKFSQSKNTGLQTFTTKMYRTPIGSSVIILQMKYSFLELDNKIFYAF